MNSTKAFRALLMLCCAVVLGCDDGTATNGSEPTYVTPSARQTPPPAPLGAETVEGYAKAPDGSFVLRSSDRRYNGMRVAFGGEGPIREFDITFRSDRYLVRTDFESMTTEVSLNGDVVSRSGAGIADEVSSTVDRERLEGVIRHAALLLGHLQREGVLDGTGAEVGRGRAASGGQGGAAGPPLGLVLASSGLAQKQACALVPVLALALQTGDYWYRGTGVATTRSHACYNAEANANLQCTNQCCIGCAEFRSCDDWCAAGSPYLCHAGIWGRSCGPGEGSCGGSGGSGGGLHPTDGW